jgi:zinc and cadmium transporter
MSEMTYILASVAATSLIAFIGIVSLALQENFLKKTVLYLVSFSAGGLFGGAFIHLIPKTAKRYGFTHTTGLFLAAGLIASFLIEQFIHWHHHHSVDHADEPDVMPFTYLIILGDGVHNFIDGIIIAASYMAGLTTGITTTVAVALHEIPQEIGDFGVLVHGGFSTRKALFFNFVSALTSFLGVGIVFLLSGSIDNLIGLLLPFTAGNFIYIAGSDLLPQITEESGTKKTVLHALIFITGILVMYAITFFLG